MRIRLWATFTAAALAGCGDAPNPPAETPNPAADLTTARPGADWPRFLGPNFDNVSAEKGLAFPLPKAGLPKVWECPLGPGYAGPAVAAGRLFHFDRFDNACRLTARVAATGQLLWKYEYPTTYEDRYGYDAGPRAGPVVDGDRVYAFGPDGMLVCVTAADGKEVWTADTGAKYGVQQNFFGVGSAPVVDGDLLLVAVGGSPKGPRPFDQRMIKPNGSGMVAFDKLTGAVKWAALDELASYSSPILATLGGKKLGLYYARGGLVGFDPRTGKQAFHYPWRAKIEESAVAANPVVVGDRVLLTECYGPGAALLDLKGGTPKEVWTDADKDAADKALMCHWNTPVHVGGFVYGSSGRHTPDADLRCVELATGDVKWSERRTTRCSLLLADGHLVSLSENGEVRLIKPNPAKYEEVSRWTPDDLEYPCWASPVVSRGYLYLRGKGKLVCCEANK